MTIFFSVGEPSGDVHGANLIRALRQQGYAGTCCGFGGPRMAAAGCRLSADMTSLSVMWLWQALIRLPQFLRLLRQADRYFRDERPDAVVLIDFPGFNWWIARRAKRRGIPVVYYGTPQIWAWATHRVHKLRRLVDHVLCKLPFEAEWFKARGCQANYVGHPYFDELRERALDAEFVAHQRAESGQLVALLPGSRNQEVAVHGPALLRAAQRIAARIPSARFAVAAYNAPQADQLRAWAASTKLPVEVHVGRTPELIEAAVCCLACSGSVSLELLYHAKPSVVLYQISRFAFAVQRRYRRVRYITLVNLLTASDPFTARPAGHYDPADPRDAHVLMPEYLTCEDRSEALADHACCWLSDAAARGQLIERLVALREQVGQGGASHRAAQYLMHLLAGRAVVADSAAGVDRAA